MFNRPKKGTYQTKQPRWILHWDPFETSDRSVVCYRPKVIHWSHFWSLFCHWPLLRIVWKGDNIFGFCKRTSSNNLKQSWNPRNERGISRPTWSIDNTEIVDRIFYGRISFEYNHVFQGAIDADLVDDLIDLTIVTNEIILLVFSAVKET